MPLARQHTDLLLADLERALAAGDAPRDAGAFRRILEYALQPILDTAEDPAYVREWVRAMLERNGHPPSLPGMEAAAGGAATPGEAGGFCADGCLLDETA